MTAKYRTSLVVLFVMGIAVAALPNSFQITKAEHNEGKVKDYLYYPAIPPCPELGSARRWPRTCATAASAS